MIRQRKPLRKKRPERPVSHLKALKPPAKRKKTPKEPRLVHVILDESGKVDVIEGGCHKSSCIRIDREHMTAQRAAEAIRKRCYERAGGVLSPKPGGGYFTLSKARCECEDCQRRAGGPKMVSWEFGHLDEHIPRGGTGGGSRESGKMSYENSRFKYPAHHYKKHSARNPRLKWLKETATWIFRRMGLMAAKSRSPHDRA